MGDEQKLPADELIRTAREAFDTTQDLTLAVEEEFAILDPETLSLTNRFEDLQAAAKGTELEPHLVGELIASEVEVRTGRCETFAEVAARIPERRAQLAALADSLGLVLAGTGTHPWSPWQEQRIIDTPHYRRNDELLRYVVWRNNSFGQHLHVAIHGADRAVKVNDGLRPFLPDLLAFSASSPFVEGVDSGLHSARTEIFTRMFPRCGIPDPYGDWATFEEYVRTLYRTGSITEHTQLWWSVRPHLGFPTVEVRICDGQPETGEAIRLAALAQALAQEERQPAAHGGADQDLRAAGEGGEHRVGFLQPARDGAVLELSLGAAVTGIVEADAGVAGGFRPAIERLRLAAGHVGAKAAEPEEAGALSLARQDGDPPRLAGAADLHMFQSRLAHPMSAAP
jgi:carboxylate-amine ligase